MVDAAGIDPDPLVTCALGEQAALADLVANMIAGIYARQRAFLGKADDVEEGVLFGRILPSV